MRNGNEAANRTDLQKLIISGGRQCGKTSVLAKILKPENPSKIRSLSAHVETLTQQNDYLRKRVEELELREAAMCDLHYANGAKQGFSWGQIGANDALDRCVNNRIPPAVRILKGSEPGGKHG